MVVRNDFLYYLIENMRFKHIINFLNYSDDFIYGWIDSFNKESYKEIFKYNSNLTLNDVKFSLKCFFDNLNFNRYDINIKYGVVDWIVSINNKNEKIRIGFDNEKSNYGKLIDKEYLKEYEKYGYYYWKD